MAIFNGKDVSVTVNSVDLSDHVVSVNIGRTRNTSDAAAMGDAAMSSTLGLQVETLSITFLQDFASSEVHDTLNGLFEDETSHTVVILPTSDSVGATNPSFTLTGYLTSYPVISASVGETMTVDCEWTNGAATGIAVATT